MVSESGFTCQDTLLFSQYCGIDNVTQRVETDWPRLTLSWFMNSGFTCQVTLLFSRYCGLGEVTQRVEMDRPNFLKICRDCELLGDDFIIADMNLLYLEATKAPPGVNIKVSSNHLFQTKTLKP
jgi:hypothetical protein